MKTFRFETVCPQCKKVCDASTWIEELSPRGDRCDGPKEGSLNICAYCGAIARFASLKKLVLMTEAQLKDLPYRDRTVILKLRWKLQQKAWRVN